MVKLNIDLPESFFQEEERDGYLVSAKTKELWAVQLDLLNEFDRVCKKYNLKYILDFGTLLGAIRHKGFIPWDDDLDVSMLREDYDKLMEIGPKEFKHPYLLQNVTKEEYFDEIVSKLRRADTTYLMTHNLQYRSPYNQGIFIDIFVFDALPSDDENVVKQVRQTATDMYIRAFLSAHRPALFDGYKLPAKVVRYLYLTLKHGSSQVQQLKRERFAKQYATSQYVGNIQSAATFVRRRSWFEKVKYVQFEVLNMPIPECYDEVLRERYGDYMTPVRGTSAHNLIFTDSSHSLSELISQSGSYKKLMKQLNINIGDYTIGFKDCLEILKIKMKLLFGSHS